MNYEIYTTNYEIYTTNYHLWCFSKLKVLIWCELLNELSSFTQLGSKTAGNCSSNTLSQNHSGQTN